MSNLQLAKQAVRLYSNPMALKATNRHNQKQWLASVRMLGDKWVGIPMKREKSNG